jgi:hypothetical protein
MPARIAGSAGNYTAMGQPREGLVTRGLTVEGPVRGHLSKINVQDTWGVLNCPRRYGMRGVG